jgi:hypothetical protein
MAANSSDLRLAFSSKIGGSILLTVDTTARQTSDDIGALPPGKYFIQALAISGVCWVKTSKWVKSAAADVVAPTFPAAAALGSLVKEFPLDAAAVRSFELHVKPGVNDRIQAICEAAGSASLVITKTGE